MEEPEAVKAAAARQTTPNDRPAPEGGTGAFVGGFVPGQAARVYPAGTAIKVPAGSTLVFQMHYTANGKPAVDRSRIGLVFAPSAPKQESIVAALVNANFTLPAGAPSTRVDAEMTMERDLTVWSLLPHTHVRGRRWEVAATYPDGRTEMLLAVPHYDFNWQTGLHLQAAGQTAQGDGPQVVGLVRQFGGEQDQPGSESRRALGRTDLGRDAVHRVHVHGGSRACGRDRRAATVRPRAT